MLDAAPQADVIFLAHRGLEPFAYLSTILDGQAIGDLDGRLISFGSDSYVNMDPHPLAENTRFMDMPGSRGR